MDQNSNNPPDQNDLPVGSSGTTTPPSTDPNLVPPPIPQSPVPDPYSQSSTSWQQPATPAATGAVPPAPEPDSSTVPNPLDNNPVLSRTPAEAPSPLSWGSPQAPDVSSTPAPTFQPPQPPSQPTELNQQPPSWTSPLQPSEESAFTPSQALPSPETGPTLASDGNTPVVPAENTPTDLSQLASVSSPLTVESTQATPDVTPAEAATVSQAINTSQVVTSSKGSPFTKWLLILGAVILLAVIGGSAYFILGIGQQSPSSNSAPIEQTPTPAPATTSTPSPALTPTPVSGATRSATFGNLSGSTPSGKTSTSSGTSAIDLLRQRQGLK